MILGVKYGHILGQDHKVITLGNISQPHEIQVLVNCANRQLKSSSNTLGVPVLLYVFIRTKLVITKRLTVG